MIWSDVTETLPAGAYIYPAYDGEGPDGRHYRPVWHTVRSILGEVSEDV